MCDDNMYAIKWKIKKTGAVGCGSYIYSRSEAQVVCNKLNENHPGIRHWIEEENP